MAKTSRTRSKKSAETTADEVVDGAAAEEESVAPEAVEAPEPDPADEAAEASAVDDEVADTSETDSIESDPDPESAEPVEEAEIIEPSELEEDTPPPMDAEPVPVPVEQVTVRKTGFFPVFLGGVVAAAMGFAVAVYLFRTPAAPDHTDAIAALISRIDALEAQVAGLPTQMPDIGPINNEIAGLSERLAGIEGAADSLGQSVDQRIAAFDTRLAEVERAPVEDDGAVSTAIASWQRELDGLREEIAAQQARIESMTAEAAADLEAARAEAAALQSAAEIDASRAEARAALAQLRVSVDAGQPFAALLAELQDAGVEAPAALDELAADGAPSLSDLGEAFPEAARAALATARAEGLADQDSGAFAAFLRNQFDVRSVTPRDGEDPDAILSRAEAALADNRLTDALAEVAALPEVVRAEMSGWVASAESRLAALDALRAIDQSLSD